MHSATYWHHLELSDPIIAIADLVWFYQNGFMLDRLERLDVKRHLEARKR